MSKGQTLRALVNERLAAAAEEIFVLIERTIVEYEEELSRSNEENQKKQQLLDQVLYPKIVLVRGSSQIPSASPGPGLTQKTTETPQIKEEPEEQSGKQEEEQLPVPVPESSPVCVKTEESSLLQQRQTEHREETQGEDISSETHFHSETEGQTEPWSDTSGNCAAAPMETEADGDQYNQNQSAPETSVHSGHMSAADGGAERKKHQCPFCLKRFMTRQTLRTHIRAHTGETPYRCLTCDKAFVNSRDLIKHKRTHTGEKPFSCSTCNKTFAQKYTLDLHARTHTGEKPYSCPYCEKHFADPSTLRRHKRTHTGEKPFSCFNCNRHFADSSSLKKHRKTHADEKPYSCSTCRETFVLKNGLKAHTMTHT